MRINQVLTFIKKRATWRSFMFFIHFFVGIPSIIFGCFPLIYIFHDGTDLPLGLIVIAGTEVQMRANL